MIITQTPLRVSLAGGGTDLADFYRQEDGATLSFAIDKYIFVIVSERFDKRIYVNYTKKEIVDSVDQIQHELVREAMRKTRVHEGVEVTMLADIPSEGSGLGSSSSLTVGLLNALYNFRGRQMPAAHLAREACEIEIDICGKPIGKQDQYIAAFGGVHEFTYQADGTVVPRGDQHSPADRRRLGGDLMLYFTDITRQASGILGEQKRRTTENIDHLRHIRQGVPRVRAALEAGRFETVGEVLHESWEMKKKLAGNISNAQIDAMYSRALEAGAVGGKIAGAGGGGFLLLYVPQARQADVRAALAEYREFPWLIEEDGSKVIFNIRRYSAR